MKVSELILRLKVICKRNNVAPGKVDVYFRENYDQLESSVKFAHEDLYDEKTNNILTSIMLLENDQEF